MVYFVSQVPLGEETRLVFVLFTPSHIASLLLVLNFTLLADLAINSFPIFMYDAEIKTKNSNFSNKKNLPPNML